jgi:hypothetical protein
VNDVCYASCTSSSECSDHCCAYLQGSPVCIEPASGYTCL